MNFQMFKLNLEKAEEPEIKLSTSVGSSKKQERKLENQKNYFCFIYYAKVFDFVGHRKLWEILQQNRIPDNMTCLLRHLYSGQ